MILGMDALFWVFVICVAAFEVVRIRSGTLRAWLRGNTPFHWLVVAAFLGILGKIGLSLAISARPHLQSWVAAVPFVVIFVSGAAIPFALSLFVPGAGNMGLVSPVGC